MKKDVMKKDVMKKDVYRPQELKHTLQRHRNNARSRTAIGDYSRPVYYCNLTISSQIPVADSILYLL